MKKKGELTTQQIVTLIIILISFVVLLIFLFLLNPAETDAKQICHNSVVLSTKGAGLVGGLDCKTSYLCVSGGSTCNDFASAATMKIDSSKKEEVFKALADEMSNCWWMFGEGKTDYTSGRIYSSKSCAICSIAKFDEKVQKAFPTISYSEFYNYLRATPKTNSQSYLQYLYSTNSLASFDQFYIKNYLAKKIDTSKEYFILTGRSKGVLWTLFGASGNNPVPATMLEKTKENYDAVGCDEFITKAS